MGRDEPFKVEVAVEKAAPLTLGEWGGVASGGLLLLQNLYLLKRRKDRANAGSKKRT